MKQVLRKRLQEIQRDYQGSGRGFTKFSMVLSSILLGSMFMGSGLPVLLDFVLFTTAFFLLILLGQFLLERLFLFLWKRKMTEGIQLVLLFGVAIGYILSCVEGKVGIVRVVACALLFTCLEWSFGHSCAALLNRRKKSWYVIGIASITVIANVLFGWGFFGKGQAENTVSRYLSQRQTVHKETSLYQKSIEKGNYIVETLEYGTGTEKALASDTANLKYYVGEYSGFRNWLRTCYWGFSLKEVPMQGKVWYPKGATNCPVVFVVHGNHSMTVNSYLGYAYLGEHLASRGYVVISVNENVLNYYIDQGLFGENAGRAALLLENMKQVEQYNKDAESPLYGTMDFESIALVGHSRGGEAVALAALYNGLERNPDNANLTFDYNFQIKSLIAIAPTVDQYSPAGKDVELQDINYLLIQGANDQDITSFLGVKQYHNVSFTGDGERYKVYKYIFGANHGQFNTVWKTDYSGIRQFLLNQAGQMKPETQRELLLGYVTAFLEDTLQGKEEYHSLLQEDNTEDAAMPRTLSMTAYEDNTFVPIATFEEDMELDTLTCENGKSHVKGMRYWKEQEVGFYRYAGTTTTDNHAVMLSWQDTLEASYTLQIPEDLFTKGKVFSFAMMDIDMEGILEGEHQQVNGTIVFYDSNGTMASIKISDYGTIVPPMPVRLYKIESKKGLDYKMNFQTIRIPYAAVKEANEKIQMEHIRSIRFQFDQVERGKLLLDQVGVTN